MSIRQLEVRRVTAKVLASPGSLPASRMRSRRKLISLVGRLLTGALMVAALATIAILANHGVFGGSRLANQAPAPHRTTVPLHYTVNLEGSFLKSSSIGFNLFDVSSKKVMDSLPRGTRGLYWIGTGYKSSCSWSISNAEVVSIVTANRLDPRLYGYYIADEPHTSACPDAVVKVKARSDLIHSIDPAAKTFIVVQDGSNEPGEYRAFAHATDLIGVDPYPCNVLNITKGCDLAAMAKQIDTALKFIPVSRIVPVFQTFGQECGTYHYYRLPRASELRSMLTIWDRKVPSAKRTFDYSYTWGRQPVACPALMDADGTGRYPNLQVILQRYFAGVARPG